MQNMTGQLLLVGLSPQVSQPSGIAMSLVADKDTYVADKDTYEVMAPPCIGKPMTKARASIAAQTR